MRKLLILACSLAAAALCVGAAGAQDPDVGVLSVERGKGLVVLDLRGSTLGRLGNGALTVTDMTPRDKYTAIVTGRKLTSVRQVGPRTMRYRGQGLRFRMLGGRYRIVVRGTGMAISAVGRGVVSLDADRLSPLEDVGVYSIDGADCSLEPLSCAPLPDEPERYSIGPVLPTP
jgi:hypothetical protein